MPAIVSAVALFRPALLIALAVGLLLAMTFALWAYYGTAVFFEMLRELDQIVRHLLATRVDGQEIGEAISLLNDKLGDLRGA